MSLPKASTYNANTLQDTLHLCPTLLVRSCGAMDPLEDKERQRRSFLGVADQAGNLRGVSTGSIHFLQ